MAEIRKKVIEDTYNTSSIKKKEQKKAEEKKSKKQVRKIKKNDNEKKNLFTKFMIFCHGVKSEFKKVHWTSKKDMIKYSSATIVFIIFSSLFFYIIDVLFALVQSLLS